VGSVSSRRGEARLRATGPWGPQRRSSPLRPSSPIR
jgi:hypothetical protein